MTAKERLIVEDLLRLLYPNHYQRGRSYHYHEVHDLYDKLERVGLMPLAVPHG